MGHAARRLTAKDPGEKLAHRRMTVLELAERLGNVSEACRRGGIDRTSFYDWKRRFQLHGLDGLKDLPPIAESHPMATPPEVVARIEELALAHPAYGCNRVEAMLALEGRRVSAITIQKILNDKALGTRHERWLALERKNAEQAIELTPGQAAFLEKLNPCFRERHVESSRPGELLGQDTFMAGTLKGIGQGHRPGLPARRGRHVRLLRLRLPARLQAARGGGGRAAQRRPAVLPRARLAGARGPD
jgi:transposase-like protein